jgi:hypothetical protein
MAPETGCFFLQKKFLPVYAAALLLILILLCIIGVRKILNDPQIPLLLSEEGADWIRFREPVETRVRGAQIQTTIFRTKFDVRETPKQAILSLRAMKRGIVWLDNQVIFQSDLNLNEWKREFQVDITKRLSIGTHELRVAVMNQNGPPAVIAFCKSLNIVTGESWEATNDGNTWKPALSVHSRQYPLECFRYFHLKPALKEVAIPLPLMFQRADRAFLSKAPVFLSIFIVVFVLTLLLSKKKMPAWLSTPIITSRGVRWIVLTAWICLAINNIGKMPLYAGMDWTEHLKYIEYVASNWRIPLATEGWQMFQSPLYYVISALFYNILINFFSWEGVIILLRIIPLACGALQIELCWRALRYAFPGREDIQILGTIVGGLLPMNIYLSQVIGNEPMAGCLSGIVVVLVIRYLKSPVPNSWHTFASIGLFLGLAMLTKATAILLVPAVLLFVAYKDYSGNGHEKQRFRSGFTHIGIILGVAFLVSGWYYIRNYMDMGRVFIGGWDASRNIIWWQYPGYRTLEQFYTFGEVLFYPIFSAVMGIWDSLYSTFWMDGCLSAVCIYDYRPPWNYGFMLSGAWLSFLPTAALGLGTIASLMSPLKEGKRVLSFCVLCVGIYLSAILYMYLIIPAYSAGKATYAVGITPCFAVLIAFGFDILTRNLLLKSIVYGLIACWAFAAYAAYIII